MRVSVGGAAGSVLAAGLLASFLHLVGGALIVGGPPLHGFQLIASGLLGQSAFSGGVVTAILGGFLHFAISVAAAAIYWVASGRAPRLATHWLASGAAYGVLAYVVMNLVVVPLSNAPPSHPSLPLIAEDLVAHVLLFGLPIAAIVSLGRRAVSADRQTSTSANTRRSAESA